MTSLENNVPDVDVDAQSNSSTLVDATEKSGLRNRFADYNDSNVYEDVSEEKSIDVPFKRLKESFIETATLITQDFEDNCDMLLIIRVIADDSEKPQISSMATRALKPVLQDPVCKSLISSLLFSENFDKASVHIESTTTNKDGTF
ncbi:hypothetical protein HK096_008129, partial [Nowakowskiella sp. JEL0078]